MQKAAEEQTFLLRKEVRSLLAFPVLLVQMYGAHTVIERMQKVTEARRCCEKEVPNVLTYADVCWRMRTYADVC
jgi:delta-aminolevulinic acid dehydratase/porphobilinogen synthase